MTHHRRGLRRLLKDDGLLGLIEEAAQASDSFESFEKLEAQLGVKRSAMLRYAMRLTLEPAAMERADFDALVREGFTDTDILHMAEVVGYYAYVNRIADGLGVLLEG